MVLRTLPCQRQTTLARDLKRGYETVSYFLLRLLGSGQQLGLLSRINLVFVLCPLEQPGPTHEGCEACCGLKELVLNHLHSKKNPGRYPYQVQTQYPVVHCCLLGRLEGRPLQLPYKIRALVLNVNRRIMQSGIRRLGRRYLSSQKLGTLPSVRYLKFWGKISRMTWTRPLSSRLGSCPDEATRWSFGSHAPSTIA